MPETGEKLANTAGIAMVIRAMAGSALALAVEIIRPTCDPLDVVECREVTFEAVARDERNQNVTGDVQWEWDFGDNTTATDNPVVHSFGDPAYTVTATGTFNGQQARDTMLADVQAASVNSAGLSLMVLFGPNCDFVAGGTVCHDCTIVVRQDPASGSNILEVRFYGDGDLVRTDTVPEYVADPVTGAVQWNQWSWPWMNWGDVSPPCPGTMTNP